MERAAHDRRDDPPHAELLQRPDVRAARDLWRRDLSVHASPREERDGRPADVADRDRRRGPAVRRLHLDLFRIVQRRGRRSDADHRDLRLGHAPSPLVDAASLRRIPRLYNRRVPVRSTAMESTLLAWYDRVGRDLPWRRTHDPYAILVSEVMLQQTQVERVVPRYLAWLERWSTVQALASATPAEVIREWQGLGYNRRALNLHRAVSAIAVHGWPSDLTELPGVGRYTAAAVRRFAWDEAVLPVDVNVARVLRRTGTEFSPAAAHALMDVGATICIARIPRCAACPLVDACPSRGIREEPRRKQGPFEGSFRQLRAETLRLVANAARPLVELDRDAVRALERDGLVVVDAEVVSLPSR
jgi:A/G-specific adenine glycosylase